MKLKSKLLLVASAALVVSGTAAGTSTFAWYTANRTVYSDITNITVRKENSSLNIAVDADNTDSGFTAGSGSGASDASRLTLSTAVGATGISDISGIGNLNIAQDPLNTSKLPDIKTDINTFVKPYIDSTGTKVAGWWTDKASIAQNFYMVTYSFAIVGETSAYLLLDPGSTITDTTGISVKNNVRFSALANTFTSTDSITPTNPGTGLITDKVVVTNSTQLFYADANGDASADKYSTGADAVGTALPGATSAVTSASPAINQVLGTDNFFGHQIKYTEADFPFAAPAAAEKLGYLCTLTSGVTSSKFASITFLFWIEGTSTSTNSLTDFIGNFKADLNFYTVNVNVQ